MPFLTRSYRSFNICNEMYHSAAEIGVEGVGKRIRANPSFIDCRCQIPSIPSIVHLSHAVQSTLLHICHPRLAASGHESRHSDINVALSAIATRLLPMVSHNSLTATPMPWHNHSFSEVTAAADDNV